MQVEDIRTVMIDGEKWYVGRDVAQVLGYANPTGAVRSHVDDEGKEKYKILVNNKKHDIIILNKHGLESLLSSSQKPGALDIAKKFNIGVTPLNISKVKDIRIVMLNGQKWYVGLDVGRALGYKKPATISADIDRNVDNKDRMLGPFTNDNGGQHLIIINKHGLEQFVSSSTAPNAINIAEKFNIKVNQIWQQFKTVEDIRTVMIDGEKWYVGIDVGRALGYARPLASVQAHVDDDGKEKYKISTNTGTHYTILINKHGLERLLSRSTLPNAISIAKKLGINVNHILNTYKEQDSIHAILKTFKGESMVRQYSVGTYRIDLYFPDYRLAIECDEFGHSYRDQEYEQTRQHYIEDKLGCKFIRYNPDSKNYNIFNVLNRIYKEMSKQ